MKRRSLIRTAAILLLIQILLVLFLTGYFGAVTVAEAQRSRESMTDHILEIYAAQLEGILSAAQDTLHNLVLNITTDLDILQSDDGNDRYYASIRIADLLENAVQGGSGIDMIVAMDQTYETSISKHRADSALTLPKRQSLLEYSETLLRERTYSNSWKSAVIGDGAYLYRCYCFNGHLAAAFIKVDRILPKATQGDTEPVSFGLLQTDGRVLACEAFPDAVGGTLPGEAQSSYHVQNRDIGETDMKLTALASRVDLEKQIRFEFLGVGALLIVLAAFTLLLLRYLTVSVLKPLRIITDQLEQMKKEENLHLQESGNSREFHILNDSFNRLMDENVNLRMKNYQKMVATQDMELKCIHLQLRPHFFLNAMTTISSLSISGKNAQIKEYIDALTKNIRYMFKSGMHTVPLAEELKHVRNYFEMQELKYPDTVFYMLEQESGTDDWPIPQMLIHTVIENEYKHAVCVGKTLTILLEIRRVSVDGDELLRIVIEDDGAGYPQEVLDRPSGGWRTDGTRVGLGSMVSMLELMYDRDGLITFSNVEPHGARTSLMIPPKPLNEYREERKEGTVETCSAH